MQLTKDLHAVLANRKKAFQNAKGMKRDDDGTEEEGSPNDDNASDGSAW
jgi:hypothetical protein